MQSPIQYYDDWDDLYGLVRDLFVAASLTCFLWAMHRMAAGLLLGSRIKALTEYREAYAPEEREVLIRKIKHESMRF